MRDTDWLFDDVEFPTTAAELQSSLAGQTIDVADGEASAAAAVERGGGDTFESREEAELALRSGVGAAAVGRRRYSDRDPAALGEDGPRPVSF